MITRRASNKKKSNQANDSVSGSARATNKPNSDKVEVVDIINKKLVNGQVFYTVKWSDNAITEEPEVYISDNPSLLRFLIEKENLVKAPKKKAPHKNARIEINDFVTNKALDDYINITDNSTSSESSSDPDFSGGKAHFDFAPSHEFRTRSQSNKSQSNKSQSIKSQSIKSQSNAARKNPPRSPKKVTSKKNTDEKPEPKKTIAKKAPISRKSCGIKTEEEPQPPKEVEKTEPVQNLTNPVEDIPADNAFKDLKKPETKMTKKLPINPDELEDMTNITNDIYKIIGSSPDLDDRPVYNYISFHPSDADIKTDFNINIGTTTFNNALALCFEGTATSIDNIYATAPNGFSLKKLIKKKEMRKNANT